GPPTLRAGPGGWHPAVTDDQFSAVPNRFVAELPRQLGPSGVTDGAGELSVAEQVGDGEVLQAKPFVGLDELRGDIVQQAPAHVGEWKSGAWMLRLMYQRAPCRRQVANRIPARGATTSFPVPASSCETGRSSRRSRRVSSCTRTVPIFGRVTELRPAASAGTRR